jgi:hypothetical protein
MSAAIAICLYSCGDCAKYALAAKECGNHPIGPSYADLGAIIDGRTTDKRASHVTPLLVRPTIIECLSAELGVLIGASHRRHFQLASRKPSHTFEVADAENIGAALGNGTQDLG